MSMFSTGVELRKAKKHDYSKLIDNDIFKMAYEDEDQDGESLKKKGKLNYVALMNNNKRSTNESNELFEIDHGDQGNQETRDDDYDRHFDTIQRGRKLKYEGKQNDVE